ncbi:MAG: amino acid ABC transporter permease [Rhodospirillales bacterium]
MRRRSFVSDYWILGLTLLFIGWFLWRMTSHESMGWYVINPSTPQGAINMQFLLGGLWITIGISIIAMVLSIAIGLLAALMNMSTNPGARMVARGYIELFRAIPLLVMLIWVYYGLPALLDIRLDPFAATVIALVLCESPFQAEIFRAGIQSIARGQHEAAEAVGLSYADKMWFIILPQALRRVLPPLANQFVYILKMSALASVIGLDELVRRANDINNNEYRPLEIYSFLVIEYLLLVLAVSWAVRRLEKKMGSDESGR